VDGTVTSHSPTDKALALVARGFHVFPCNDDKSPACPHGHLDASCDPLRVKMLFAGAPNATLVGISCPASHIHVLDIDPQGLPFYEQHKHLVPDTVKITTRRGGLHLQYRADDPQLVVKNGAGGGIDVRSGNAKGGYIIAWGEAYQYDLNRMSPEWPEAFVSLARAQPKTNGHTTWLPLPTMPSHSPATIADEIRAVAVLGHVPIGERDHFLMRAYGHAQKARREGMATLEQVGAFIGRISSAKMMSGDLIHDFEGKLRRAKFTPQEVAFLLPYENNDDGEPIVPFPKGGEFPVDPFEGYESIHGGQTGFGTGIFETSLDSHPLAEIVPYSSTVRIPEYVIPNFIGAGLVTIAGGHGKGKTTALVALALIVAGLGAAGHELAQKPGRWRHVVYITEDDGQVQRILNAHEMADKLSAQDINDRFHIVLAKRLDAKQFVRIGKWYQEQYAREADGAVLKPLVIVDTKSASFEVEDENSNAEASKIAACLKQDFERLPTFLVGHISKEDMTRQQARSMRGATAIEADAVQNLYFAQEEDGSRYIVRGKTRFEASVEAVLVESEVTMVQGTDMFSDTDSVPLRWARVRSSARVPGQVRAGKGDLKSALQVLEDLITSNTPPAAAPGAQNNRFSDILMQKLQWPEALAKQVISQAKAKGLIKAVKPIRAKGATHNPWVFDLTQEGREYLSGAQDFDEASPF